MSDRFPARIIFPAVLSEHPDIKEYMENVSDESEDLGDGTIDAQEYSARNGYPEIEEALVQLGVAFDRHSDSYCEFNAEWRIFRPAPNHVDRTIPSNQDGDLLVPLDTLKKLEKKFVSGLGTNAMTLDDIKTEMGLTSTCGTVADWVKTNQERLQTLMAQADEAL